MVTFLKLDNVKMGFSELLNANKNSPIVKCSILFDAALNDELIRHMDSGGIVYIGAKTYHIDSVHRSSVNPHLLWLQLRFCYYEKIEQIKEALIDEIVN